MAYLELVIKVLQAHALHIHHTSRSLLANPMMMVLVRQNKASEQRETQGQRPSLPGERHGRSRDDRSDVSIGLGEAAEREEFKRAKTGCFGVSEGQIDHKMEPKSWRCRCLYLCRPLRVALDPWMLKA